MAKLEGRAALVGPVWFSLAPLRNDSQDATEYRLELFPGDHNALLARTFSVADWQMGQNEVWMLARAFAEASTLVETTIPVDLWRTGKPAHAYWYQPVDWLHAVLWGNKRRQTIAIRLFVREQNDPELFRTFFIQSAVSQVAQFGRKLEREIIEASPNWARENDHTVENEIMC